MLDWMALLPDCFRGRIKTIANIVEELNHEPDNPSGLRRQSVHSPSEYQYQ